jgi:hypothetical protein
MARSVAGQIDRFHDAWRGALAASSRRDKLSRLESALRLDERIAKGHHGNKIRPLLMDVYVDEATSAWSSGRHVKACQSALRAINIGGSSSQARRIADQCEGKAQEYYRQGHALGESDLNQAKGLWRKVLNMVPRSSEVYSKAYTSLNNAGLGRYQDEDE